jgi:hypothetical protein
MSLSFKKLNPAAEKAKEAEIAARHTQERGGWLSVPCLAVQEKTPTAVRFLPQAEGSAYDWWRDIEVLYMKVAGSTPGEKDRTHKVIPAPGLIGKIGRLLYTNSESKARMSSSKNREDKAAVKIPSRTRRVFLCVAYPAFDKVLALDAPKAYEGSSKPQLGDRLVAFCTEETMSKTVKYGHIADVIDGSVIVLTPEKEGEFTTLNPSVDSKSPLTEEQLVFWEKNYVDLEKIVAYSDYQTVLDASEAILPTDMFEMVRPLIDQAYPESAA